MSGCDVAGWKVHLARNKHSPSSRLVVCVRPLRTATHPCKNWIGIVFSGGSPQQRHVDGLPSLSTNGAWYRFLWLHHSDPAGQITYQPPRNSRLATFVGDWEWRAAIGSETQPVDCPNWVTWISSTVDSGCDITNELALVHSGVQKSSCTGRHCGYTR